MRKIGDKAVFPYRGMSDQEKLNWIYQFVLLVVRVPELGACWEETLLSKSNTGYPHMHSSHGSRTVVQYVLFVRFGHWPEAVGHICNNPACINPAHLEEITQRLNMIDGAQFGQKRERRILCTAWFLAILACIGISKKESGTRSRHATSRANCIFLASLLSKKTPLVSLFFVLNRRFSLCQPTLRPLTFGGVTTTKCVCKHKN